MGQLDGKVAIITGAASGIGAAATRLFVAEGAKVVLADIQEEAGKKLAAELGNSTLFVRLDVTSEADWAKVVEATLAKFGRIDVLFNNAAIRDPKPLKETTVADMQRSFMINAVGPLLGMKATFDELAKTGNASIINVSSGNAVRTQPGTFPYTASKWAIRGISAVAASEFAGAGIRVNNIIPGMVATPMHATTNTAEILAHYEALVPMKRNGRPEELAQVALFLASDASSYMTGAEVHVDGGVLL